MKLRLRHLKEGPPILARELDAMLRRRLPGARQRSEREMRRLIAEREPGAVIYQAITRAAWPTGTLLDNLSAFDLGDQGWYFVQFWCKPPPKDGAA